MIDQCKLFAMLGFCPQMIIRFVLFNGQPDQFASVFLHISHGLTDKPYVGHRHLLGVGRLASDDGLIQLPVLADCYRALGRLNDVHDVWDRLRHADPDAQTITEGRIVAAGALADEGRPRDAIRLLEAGPLRPKRPKDHHLRLWYALADLYDRVGDLQRARRGFARIADVEPEFVDVADRLAALGTGDTGH